MAKKITEKKTLHFDLNDIEDCLNNVMQIIEWKDYKNAQQILKALSKKYPQNANVLFLSGKLAHKENRNHEAIQFFQQSLTQHPNNANAHFHLSALYYNMNNAKLAKEHTKQALKCNPNHVNACYNHATELVWQGEFKAALEYYTRTLATDPSHIKAKHNLGLLQLRLGNFKSGWDNYACRFDPRFQSHEYIHPSMKQWMLSLTTPTWHGENLKNKRLLVWTEQGIGDEIMFAQCLYDLQKLKAKTTFLCYPRMIPIYKRTFSDITFIGNTEDNRNKVQASGYDFHCSVGNLAQFLRKDIKDINTGSPYLSADKKTSHALRKKYTKAKANKIIGISWKGGASNGQFQKRILPLSEWLPILQTKNITFINLQYGNTTEEIKQLSQQKRCDIISDNTIDPLKNMDDFAAQVQACDLVISVDNSTVHMAGALGKPVWNFLSYVPDWRWMTEREDTPWYPSMRLFRQKKSKDWAPAIDEVKKALEKFVSEQET